jgi:hypothetical protein
MEGNTGLGERCRRDTPENWDRWWATYLRFRGSAEPFSKPFVRCELQFPASCYQPLGLLPCGLCGLARLDLGPCLLSGAEPLLVCSPIPTVGD